MRKQQTNSTKLLTTRKGEMEKLSQEKVTNNNRTEINKFESKLTPER